MSRFSTRQITAENRWRTLDVPPAPRDKRRRKTNSPIEPESSTNMTVSNKANLARSIAISIGMFH